MSNIEVEVKFFLPDPQALRRKIIALGARSRGRVFERNVCFDSPDERLMKRNALLRLRKDAVVTLTFKSPLPVAEGEFKVRKELEVEVADFVAMRKILIALGFRPVHYYEKWRETYELGAIHFCLDQMPFGNFLEIEGPQSDIRTFSRTLGLRWNRRILLNYLAIFERLRKEMKWPFTEPTFDNLDTVPEGLDMLIDRMQVGDSREDSS